MFNIKNKKEEGKTDANLNNSKVLSGVVVSSKMTDTIVVEVVRYFKHSKYGKFITTKKRYKVHDAGNTASVGDKVEIVECRPISKDKRFKLLNK